MSLYSCKNCSAKYQLACGQCGGTQFLEESWNMAPSSHKDMALMQFHGNENVAESNLCTEPNLYFDQQRLLQQTDMECHRNEDSDVSNVRSQRIDMEDMQPLDHIGKYETEFKWLMEEIENNNRDPTQISRPTVIVGPGNEDAQLSNFRRKENMKEGQQCESFSKNHSAMTKASPFILNTCSETQTSRAQDNEERISNFNYAADTTRSSRENPQHLNNLYGQSSITEHSIQSYIEMMLGKQITAESSPIEGQDGEVDQYGSPPCRSHLPQSVPEDLTFDHNARHTRNKVTSCATEPFWKRRILATKNSPKKPKMQWAEKYSTRHAPLAEDSASEAANQHFESKKCAGNFTNENSYTIHMDAQEKQIQSDESSKEFRDENMLREFCAVHIDERPFKCEICGEYSGKTESHLMSHMMLEHPSLVNSPLPIDKERKCLHCFRIANESELDENVQSDTALNAFKCDPCSAEFHCEHELNSHLNTTHNGEERFKCDLCEHAATTKDDLTMHRNTVHKK